jgi:Flp pilus assembly protein TadB
MDPFADGSNNSQNFQQNPQDGMAWWLKYLIKGAAVFLGFMALILGVVTAISISFSCIIGGILLMYVFRHLHSYFVLKN